MKLRLNVGNIRGLAPDDLNKMFNVANTEQLLHHLIPLSFRTSILGSQIYSIFIKRYDYQAHDLSPLLALPTSHIRA